jgi:hypothetical protein
MGDASPFVPDMGDDTMMSGALSAAPPAPKAAPPPDDGGGVNRKRMMAALAALSSLAMFTPVGKTGKGLAAALGLGGGLTLANEAMAAGKKKPPAETASIATAPPAPAAADPNEIQDEHTANLRALTAQRDKWQALLMQGNPKPETQAQVSDLNRQIKEIEDARATKAKGIAGKERAEHGERLANYFRIGEGGLGLGLGALVAAMSRGKAVGAAQRFERAGADVAAAQPAQGNVLLAKGDLGTKLHAGVNDAYVAGGAEQPFPRSLDTLYGARNKGELQAAKDTFREDAARVPTNAPFSEVNSKKLTKLPAMVEKGLPAGFGLEAGAGFGSSYLDSDENRKPYENAGGWGGLTGLVGYSAARKGFGILAQPKINDAVMRAVNAGRGRLERDVQTVGPKDLKNFTAKNNEATALPAPKPGRKGVFAPGTAEDMAALRNYKGSSMAQARAQFMEQARVHDPVIQALHSSKDPATGAVDRAAFRKALRQIYTATTDVNGHRVQINDTMVRELLKAMAH